LAVADVARWTGVGVVRVPTGASAPADGPVPVQRIADSDLLKGQTFVQEYGTHPQKTSVHRLVYASNGTLLHDDTWSSYSEGEKQIVKYGTKEPPPPPTTETTTTGKTETTPTQTSTTSTTTTATTTTQR
jgi:hypothetical protein